MEIIIYDTKFNVAFKITIAAARAAEKYSKYIFAANIREFQKYCESCQDMGYELDTNTIKTNHFDGSWFGSAYKYED